MAKQLNAIEILSYTSGPGIKERIPVKTVALINLNLATNLDSSTVSGYTLATGDRFIAAAQTVATQNGIYVVDTQAYRAVDYYEGDLSQSYVTVTDGTYADTEWQAVGDGTIGVGAQGWKMKNNIAYVAGSIPYASTSSTIANLAPPVGNSFLSMAGTVPAWATTIGVANGGTGGTTFTAGSIILGNGVSGFGTLNGVAYRNLGTNGAGAYENTNNAYITTIRGANVSEQLILGFTDAVASVANFRLNNKATPELLTEGVAANIGLALRPKGEGYLDLLPDGGSAKMKFHSAASYVALKVNAAQALPVEFTLPVADGSNGHVLKTNGTGALSFGPISSTINLNVLEDPVVVGGNKLNVVSTISYHTAAYGVSQSAVMYYEVNHVSNFTVQIWNDTTSSVIASSAITTSGFKTLAFTTPAVNSRVQLRVQRTSPPGSSTIYGMQMQITV
jgi:hypothetical protein